MAVVRTPCLPTLRKERKEEGEAEEEEEKDICQKVEKGAGEEEVAIKTTLGCLLTNKVTHLFERYICCLVCLNAKRFVFSLEKSGVQTIS